MSARWRDLTTEQRATVLATIDEATEDARSEGYGVNGRCSEEDVEAYDAARVVLAESDALHDIARAACVVRGVEDAICGHPCGLKPCALCVLRDALAKYDAREKKTL